ncbi:hypothetical protein BDW74DRAFT_102300 [Aspergillus multicolor]|uniref:arrestin C-terminal domain-containing protein n=1 Tax=Aspergillus multicolor TaxID=41759 RepID=UPI003CCCBA62
MAIPGCNLHFEFSPGSDRLFLQLDSDRNDDEKPRIVGVLVMSFARPTRISSIRVTLEGVKRRRWIDPVAPGVLSKEHVESTVFYRSWPLIQFPILKGRVYAPGRHDIPLDIILDSLYCVPETVDGVEGYQVSYSLVGHVGRRLASDLTCDHNIKIYSTLSRRSIQYTMPQATLDNEWPGKVQYSLSLADALVPFGSDIRPYLHILPLTEGLQIESIEVKVIETHGFAPSTPYYTGCQNRTEQERVVSARLFTSAKDMDSSTIDEGSALGISLLVSLPASLTHCAQDVRTSYFDIRHRAVFTIRLINLDGHISMIRASLPLVIYMHVADNAQLRNFSLYARNIIPPSYGEHEEDPVIADDSSAGPLTRSSSTLWEDGTILCRTPSYTSIAESRLVTDSALPPAYF